MASDQDGPATDRTAADRTAADRTVADEAVADEAAADEAVRDGAVPPRGWEVPRSSDSEQAAPEPLAQLVQQLLALVPEELRVRVTEAARALLEALRALIDWCVARLERHGGAGGPEVRDIPIL